MEGLSSALDGPFLNLNKSQICLGDHLLNTHLEYPLLGPVMAYFFFFDESGTDKHESPYEVLCGVAIKDNDLWQIISQLKDAEAQILGTRYGGLTREIKGRKFLNKKAFRHASLEGPIPDRQRASLAKDCIENGESATRREIAALGQAKLAYVERLLEICGSFRVKVFASISQEHIRETDQDSSAFLRRDYVYAFERMYYFLDDKISEDQGIVVFDELEKSQSHMLVNQLENYFKKTAKGRQRSGLIIPEPFFVHSDLTTGIQIADIIAYIIAWGFRLNGMTKPVRPEMVRFAELIKPLRYRTTREIDSITDMEIWSVTYVK